MGSQHFGGRQRQTSDPLRMHDALFPVSVPIGGVEKSALIQSLRERRVRFNQAAEDLFQDARFTTRDQRTVVEIASVSVGSLGFGEGATYDQLVARARECGLSECPLELGLHLRLLYMDQPDSSQEPGAVQRGRAPRGSMVIASRPLDELDETPKGFYLRRFDGDVWLRGYWSWPGHILSPEDVLVFARDQSTAEAERGQKGK